MNSYLKKIVVAIINNQWLNRAKDLTMGYAKNKFVDIMNWLYIRYRKFTHGYLMKNQDTMQTSYHVEELIQILFNKIKTVQEFMIAGNSPFFYHQLVDMGTAQILATQEYTHVYHM